MGETARVDVAFGEQAALRDAAALNGEIFYTLKEAAVALGAPPWQLASS